jgi:molecular chaperone DnaK (HSP70)
VDFGTATTLVAYADGVGAALVPIGRSTTAMPSTVALAGDGWPTPAPREAGPGADSWSGLRAGEDAEAASPDQVIRSAKRAITQGSDSFVLPRGSGPPVTVPADEAVAAVLREAVARARAAGVPLSPSATVRLGCPASWDGVQRRRLVGIAARAGLPVEGLVLIEEPVAAGMAWLTHRYLAAGERPTGTMLVFDMGGGTLDVAVLRARGGPRAQVTVLSCLGSASAGDALDATLARDLAAEVAAHDVDEHLLPEVAWALLERAARETKVRLSQVEEHPVVLPRQLRRAGDDAGLARHPVRYHRRRLESLFASHVDGACAVVISALRLARLGAPGAATVDTGAAVRALAADDLTAGVDFVLLVGGMSRIPYLADRLAALMPAARIIDDLAVGPEEAVAAGLADPLGYDGVRLHRPPFDIVLDTDDGRVVAYEAHTPVVEAWQLYSGHSELGYDRWLRPPDLPDRGTALLRAVTATGEPLWLTVDGRRLDGLPVALGPAGVGLGLTCDGRMAIVDGAGAAVVLAGDGWPLPGPDRAGPVLRRLPTSP